MNTLPCNAQLLFSCLTACRSSCLSTRSPDYLPTYRAAFVQIKRGRDEGEAKYYFFSLEFILRRRCVEFLTSKPHSLPPLPTVQSFSIILSDSLSPSLPVCLNIPVISVSLCIPPCSLSAECLPLLDISIILSYRVTRMLPENSFTDVSRGILKLKL